MGVFKEGEGRCALWICCGSGKQTASQELLDTTPMACGQVTSTEPHVDQVNAIGVDDSEWTGAPLWACTRFPRQMTKLYLLPNTSQAVFPEEVPCPFL